MGAHLGFREFSTGSPWALRVAKMDPKMATYTVPMKLAAHHRDTITELEGEGGVGLAPYATLHHELSTTLCL